MIKFDATPIKETVRTTVDGKVYDYSFTVLCDIDEHGVFGGLYFKKQEIKKTFSGKEKPGRSYSFQYGNMPSIMFDNVRLNVLGEVNKDYRSFIYNNDKLPMVDKPIMGVLLDIIDRTIKDRYDLFFGPGHMHDNP